MKNIIVFLFLLFFGFFLPNIQAVANQPSPFSRTHRHIKYLTLKEAVLLAVRQSPNVRNAQLQRVVDKFELEVARYEFKPRYSLSTSANYMNEARPSYNISPSITLNTPLGTSFQANLQKDFLGGGNNSHNIDLTVTQPLLRGARPSIVLSSLHNALDQEVVNKLSLRDTLMSTIVETIAAYHQLMEDHSSLTVQKLALQQSLNRLKQYKVQLKIGTLSRISLVEQQSQVASQQLALDSAENVLEQDRRKLLITLGLDPWSPIDIVEENVKQPNFKNLDLRASVELALKHNINYQIARINLNSLRRNLAVQRDEQLWKLDLVGNLNFSRNRLADQEDLFNTDGSISNSSRSVSLNLEVPIDDIERKQGLVSAKIELEKAKNTLQQTRDQVIVSVNDFLDSLRSQGRQLVIAADKVKLAKQTYHATVIGRQQGLFSEFETVRQQTDLIDAQLDLISRRIAYLDAWSDFRRFLGKTLDDWDIRVVDG